MRARMARHPQNAFRGEGGVGVTGVRQDADGVHVEYAEPDSGATGSRRARYVLGCAGADSLVRRSAGPPARSCAI
ncbi:FAD-dependent monooxygenase [Actinocorallia libanotica]|uniref:FAD-binding domain-containing protein n=1 Tax=Actinocorallia libanotica TaxID=46162 RepID=A0ABP4AM06_9ACTN